MDYREDNELVQLVKQSDNKKLQSILEGANDASNGTALLHLAISENNMALIKHWLDAGYDVDGINSSGDTALVSALISNNFVLVKMLLDANADTCVCQVSSGKNTLDILMDQPKKVVDDILPHFVDNFKRRNVDVERIFESVILAKCNFEQILLLNNAWITRKYLERSPKFSYSNYWFAIEQAIKLRDFESVQVFLSSDEFNMKLAFLDNLNCLFLTNQIELWKIFIGELPHFNMIVEWVLAPLNWIFKKATVEYIRILLDCKIYVNVGEKFDIDLRTALFFNENVDAIELLRGHNFNINSEGYRENSALHFAIEGHVKNVQFLLESGANTEAKNYVGRTPLMNNCKLNRNVECGKLLLEYGANVQCVDYHKQTVFHFIDKNFPLPLLEYLIARLALDHEQGVTIKKVIRRQIYANKKYRNFYETCCQQLQTLKTYEIVESLTLYNLLTGKIEMLCRFLFNQEHSILPQLEQYQKQHQFNLLYYDMMKNKLMKMSKLLAFNCSMAEIISTRTGKAIDLYHLIIRHISQYLTFNDINEFIVSVALNK